MLLFYQTAWFFLVSIHIGRMKISNCIYYNEFNIINIDLTKQWQWSSFFPLSQSKVQFNLFDSCRFNTVSLIYFHSFRSIDSIWFDDYNLIRFDTIYIIILYSFYYTHHGLLFYILSPLFFIHVPTPSYSEDLFDLIRFNTVSFICFHSIDSIHYNSIRSVYLFILIYSFHYTHHGLFILVTPPSYSEDLFDLIRFNTVSFICFHSIDTIRYDLFIYLNLYIPFYYTHHGLFI
jgi:hypothetical protein